MTSKDKYYPYIDSLRAIACVFVIIFHGYTKTFLSTELKVSLFEGGYIGVDLFFVLSGFLITGILTNQFTSTGKIHIWNFYKKRLLRLYPPLIVATLIFLVPVGLMNWPFALSNMFFLLTYTGDIVILFQKIFPALQYPSMFSHCWSLAVEEQFYIFFPLFFSAVLTYFSRQKTKNIISSFLLFNLVFVTSVIVLIILMKAYFYKFFLWRFLQIFFGGYLALIYSESFSQAFPQTSISANTSRIVKRVYENKVVGIAAFIIFFLMFLLNFTLNFFNLPLNYYLLTVVSSIIIVNAFLGKNLFYKRLLSNKKLIYLGKISYGLYLYHAPIFYLKELNLFKLPTSIKSSITFDVISVTITLIIAIASYELIEKRFLKYKKKLVV